MVMVLFFAVVVASAYISRETGLNKPESETDVVEPVKVIPSYSEDDVFVHLKIIDYVQKNLTLLKDGTLIYTEAGETDVTYVSRQDMESLKQAINDNDFFSLHTEYQAGCDNCVGHTLTVNLEDRSHRVYCYDGCPEEFHRVKDKVKSLWPREITYVGFA